MSIKTSIVTDEADFPELCEVDYEGWQHPYNPQLKHFRPKSNSREEAIAWNINNRIEKFRKQDPNTFVIKCVDSKTNKILGYATWALNNPSGEEEPVKASWYPEGSDEREFAERFINGLWRFLEKRVSRPHMDLLGIVVHPDYRMRGVGKSLIRWGIDKADELGVETVISSLKSARGAYERAGLGAIEIIPPDQSLNVENPSETWRKLQEDDLEGWLMWRPIGHDYAEGVDKAPWL